MQIRRIVGVAATLIAMASPLIAQRAMTPHDLWTFGRVNGPVLSPDGKTVLYTVTRYDLETLKSKTDLYSIPTTGGAATLVHSPANSPVFTPDGRIAYISGGQVYIGDRKVTDIANGAGGPIVFSKDGTKLLVNSSVTPPGDSLAARFAALAKGKSQARIYDELGYRHWDEWEDGDRSHVFVVDVATGAARDVTPGSFDSPPIALEGFQDYDISPDGSQVVYTANKHVPTMVGTGNDIWLVGTGSGTGEAKLMVANEANDNSPVYSPDGKYIAWIAMERPAFESDLARLKVFDRATGKVTDLSGALDLPVGEFKWSADSKTLYFTAQDQLYNDLFRVGLDGKPAVKLTHDVWNSGFAVTPDGKTIVVARQSVASPIELFTVDAKGNAKQLTHVNDDLLKQLALQPVEPFWFTGAEGAKVEGFIVKPPHFDAAKKYPVLFLIHGGPQGAWEDNWSYRWNPNQFAAPGYVIVAINPRGSTGYGQKFTDEISGDWGGKVYTDLMNGLDYALQNNAYMDTSRVAAAGASYGGYMINWINGHTNRFKALILHDGMFNTHSAYGSTEEMWFPEWEFKGVPWEHPELYDKWNPANYAQNMKTPTLVIHGALDYRLSLEQGLMAFTTLRRQGVPARLVVFPDEGHWVLKPANAFVWWGEMLGWLHRYIGGQPISTN